MLDNRLKKCAELVSGKGVAVDVGTDHAYLAAELIRSGKCEKVIASDVNEGPLESAERTVEKYGVADKVELILSDGLENVPLDDVTDIVIAGMGGETIAEILQACPYLADENINLILQPMTKAEELRAFLGENGFRIKGEYAVGEGERIYIILYASYNGIGFEVSEFKNMRGFIDINDTVGYKYLKMQSDVLKKKADALEKAGKSEDALHNQIMAANLLHEREKVSIASLYDYLDRLYPFSLQESWDNSGFLIENYKPVSTVLLTLDIDISVIEEAILSGADVIISHHPVIFKPLKRVTEFSPVMELIRHNIGAICMHTNLDIANGGTNSTILRKLSESFELEDTIEPFEECGADNSLGYIVTLKEAVPAGEFGSVLKKIFGCEYVRMNKNNCGIISRVAFCSGSGGSMLDLALEKGCDAYITGDVKHDVWIDANNSNIALFDCGHFHTENIVLKQLRNAIEKEFPQLEVIIAENSTDPCNYI